MMCPNLKELDLYDNILLIVVVISIISKMLL